MSPAVTVVGSLNLDLIAGVAALPSRGETVIADSTTTGPGGKGANQAAAAAALCEHVAMVGRVGSDSAGQTLIRDLAQRGVDVSAVLATAEQPTGTATVAVEHGTGENLIVVAPGANGAVTAHDVQVAAVRNARVVLLQLEIPLTAVTAAVRSATGFIVLNPAPTQPLPDALLSEVDVLVPNEWELQRLTGTTLGPGASLDRISAAARSIAARNVVATLGERGALVVPGDGPFVHLPPPAIKVVDTTGAGDCFCGALSVALSSGAPLVEAARFAVVAAALSTTGPGARGHLPGKAEVRALLEASAPGVPERSPG